MDTPNILRHLHWQAGWCVHLGSRLNGSLLEAMADDLGENGVLADLLSDWTEDPTAAALGLRLTGALQNLVRQGKAPALVAAYDDPHGRHDSDHLRTAITETVTAHGPWITAFIKRPVQTNEIGRSACLLGGFLEIAKHTQRPLRLLEIGSSGGLNLLWDQFHYDLSGLHWGDAESPVQLFIKWQGNPPALDASVRVDSRRGCDINPINLTTHDDVSRAESYIWPGQTDRLVRFQAGVELARRHNIQIEEANAATWLTEALDKPTDGLSTVIFHSIMWQYMPIDTQKECRRAIEEAGARAPDTAPLAWLRMEPALPDSIPELTLTQWPDGHTRRLAWCHPHGMDLRWEPEDLD